jgi:hypothetical protein
MRTRRILMNKKNLINSFQVILFMVMAVLYSPGLFGSKQDMTTENPVKNPSTRFLSGKVVLPDLHQPDSIAIYRDRLFVTDYERTMVYSLDDFRKLKEFGIKGQGPGEFLPYPEIQDQGKIKLSFLQDHIWVGSRNKVSRFNLEGEFLQDFRILDYNASQLTPFGDGFTGFQVNRFPDWKLDFYLYNRQGEKEKLLCSISKSIHTEKSSMSGPKLVFLDLLYAGPEFQVFQNQIFILGRDSRYIDVFDTRGNKIKSFDCDFPRLKISPAEREKIWDIYRKNLKNIWPQARKIITVPGYYPRYRSFRFSNDQIYVQTYQQEQDRTVFYVFSLIGESKQKMTLPLVYKNFLTPYPYVFDKDMLYTLVENIQTGDWELRFSKIIDLRK